MQLISQNHPDKLIVLNLYHILPRQATDCNKTSPWTSLKLPSNTLLTDFKITLSYLCTCTVTMLDAVC